MEDPREGNTKSQGPQASEQSGAVPTETAPASKDTVKEKLDQRKRDNQIAQIESDNQKELSDNLKKDFDELDKLFNEIDQLVTSYKEAYDNLKSQEECVKRTHDISVDEINKEIPKDKIKEINDKIDAIKKEKKDLEDYIPILLGKCSGYRCSTDIPEVILDYSEAKAVVDLKTAESEEEVKIDLKIAEKYLKCAEENHETKQKTFDDLKNKKRTIEENFKKIDDLKNKKDKESKAGNKYNEYFYIKEIEEVLNDTEISKPAELKEGLEKALEELVDAKRDLCMKKYVKNKVKDTLDATRKNLEEAEKNFDKDILEKISRIQ